MGLVTATAAPAQVAPRKLVPVLLTRGTVAYDVDNTGLIAGFGPGTVSNDYLTHAYRWNDGAPLDLGFIFSGPDAHHAQALGINDRGHVVGTQHRRRATNSNFFDPFPFLWKDGAISELPTFGISGVANDVNRRGVIVGRARFSPESNDSHAVMWEGGHIVDLHSLIPGNPEWLLLDARAINDAGQIVGVGAVNWTPSCTTCARGFLLDGGTITEIGMPDSTYCEAWDINERGQVVGTCQYDGPRAFLWEDGATTDLGPEYRSGPNAGPAINDHGQVVGTFLTPSQSLSAFLWQDGRRIDLASLLDPAYPVGNLRTIGAINNAGQIVGGTSGSRAFLLDLYACADTDGNGNPDNDGDGLCDNWETEGIDVDRDGTVDLTLYDLDEDGVIEPAERADPNHKDLFVEIDWMAEHVPFATALRRVVESFADAPVDNPDGTTGIRLHLLVDEEAVAHRDRIAFGRSMPATTPDYDDVKAERFGTAAERASGPRVLDAKRLVFRYALFAHLQSGGGESGMAEVTGDDLIVSLGAFARVGGHNRGTVDQQAGVFMHELGHTLGRRHGGGDSVNCKPNYLSVMSYSRVFDGGPIVGRPLDFSPTVLPSLDERSLNEIDGILGPTDEQTAFTPPPPDDFLVVVPADAAIDWNVDGNAEGVGVAADVNGPCDPTNTPVLVGADDWSSLQYAFRHSAAFANGVQAPVEDQPGEPTLEDALAMSPDTDGDGMTNVLDNCMTAPNPDQADGDADAAGDVCDNCPVLFNPEQEDDDGDGIGNACDPSECGTEACDGQDRDCDGLVDAADPDCPTCGDGVIGGGEACDDGDTNGTPRSCCSPTCTAVPSGTACDDGNACTVAEVCDGGYTCSGSPAPCDDGNACTDDACDPASGCVSTSNTAPCNDGDACTGPDVCGDGTCTAGPPVYAFGGFRAPTDAAPILNVGRAGRTFPLKWQLPLCAGGYVSRLDAVVHVPLRSRQIACDADAPQDAIESDTAGASGLTYDATADEYHYNWQTSASFAGKCYELLLELDDGTTHAARFRLTK